jgi:biotin carboxylase
MNMKMSRHILVLNRFDASRGCRYTQYIDHTVDRVAYLTTAAHVGGVDRAAAEVVVTVADLGDHVAAIERARDLTARFGAFDHVIALYERDLDLAAALRAALGVPGPRPDQVRKVRDKVIMKELVAAAGLRVPRFVPAESSAEVLGLADEVGFPVVLKPRDGDGSQGIILVNSRPSLVATLESPPAGYLCEEFVDAVMYQVDGVVDHTGVVRALRSARLLSTCLDYALGEPFGSVANDDADLERRLVGYSEQVLAALDVRGCVFHLEVFVVDGDSIVFLEIAARAGGAEVPHIWREVYGQDLLELAVRLALGEDPPVHAVDVAGEAGGYLLMPEPPTRPCRVVDVVSLIDRIPAMYDEAVPPAGTIMDGTGGPAENGGRYRFRADTGQAIQAAIEQVIAEYELTWEPLPAGHTAARALGRVQSVVRP